MLISIRKKLCFLKSIWRQKNTDWDTIFLSELDRQIPISDMQVNTTMRNIQSQQQKPVESQFMFL